MHRASAASSVKREHGTHLLQRVLWRDRVSRHCISLKTARGQTYVTYCKVLIIAGSDGSGIRGGGWREGV